MLYLRETREMRGESEAGFSMGGKDLFDRGFPG